MIIQNFDLNLIPDSAPVVVHCDQYDHGTGRLVIHLHDGVTDYEPTGSAIIQGIKPDMRGFAYDATLSGNTVTADLTEQMTAVDGAVQCQIVVTETTGRTGTFVFTLSVQRSALPDDTSLSDSDYQLIEDALEAAEDSEAWAVGERGGVPVPAGDPTYNNNSKYWADIASQYAQGGLIYKGSCLFANIPVTGLTSGDMWNIEDDFTTDSRFQEGPGIFVKAGTNIAWNGLKWDLLATGGGGVPIPVYYVQVSATPTSSSPIVIAGLDFSKVFKLIVSTASTTPVSLGSIYINNGTSTKRFYAYSKRTDSTGLTNVTSYMDICYGSASYCAALEFLCQSNKDNTYLAIYAGDDYVPTNLNALSDVTLGTLADGQVLKYDATTQKWVNGAGGSGAGDMLASVYDPDGDVATAGGIEEYVNSNYISDIIVSNVSGATGTSIAYQRVDKTKNGQSAYFTLSRTRYMQITNVSGDSYTFSHSSIKADSAIEVFTDTWGDNPDAVTVSAGTCNVHFETTKTRIVRIYIINE